MNIGIDTVFLILGRGCNLQCKYCIQHDVVDTILPSKINYEVLDYLIDLANNNNGLRIQFYGGEPLVYWNTIKDIVSYINEHTNKIYFTTISNGKLLDDEKVEYINKYFKSIAISWDGRNSSITRGYNIVENKGQFLRQLNYLTISGVLSAFNYPLDFIEDYEDLIKDWPKDKHINLNIDELLDVNIQNPDLKEFDYNKLAEQMNILCKEYKQSILTKKVEHLSRFNWIQQKINNIKYTVNNPGEEYIIMARCGNGYNIMNLDLDGNFYLCHNTDVKLGTIKTPIIQLVRNTIKLDRTNDNNVKCSGCAAQVACRNGCPIVSDEAREQYYCRQINTIIEPILNMILELGNTLG